jgi:hypothetical protein
MRNKTGLNPDQIARCKECWDFLIQSYKPLKGKNAAKIRRISLDVSEASTNGSSTRFNEDRLVLFLGADAYPGTENDANSRMSYTACLAHELSHIERYFLGFTRPFVEPDSHLDEAEASINASFIPAILFSDRDDLVGDAKLRLDKWRH